MDPSTRCGSPPTWTGLPVYRFRSAQSVAHRKSKRLIILRPQRCSRYHRDHTALGRSARGRTAARAVQGRGAQSWYSALIPGHHLFRQKPQLRRHATDLRGCRSAWPDTATADNSAVEKRTGKLSRGVRVLATTTWWPTAAGPAVLAGSCSPRTVPHGAVNNDTSSSGASVGGDASVAACAGVTIFFMQPP
jgi:hypothetical protein